jgi:hypothetical protein
MRQVNNNSREETRFSGNNAGTIRRAPALE